MSTPVVEASLAFSWLSSVLTADSQLMAAAPGGVWKDMAPPESAAPYVIVGMQAGSDVLTANAFRLWSEAVFQVKAVGPSANYGALVTAYARIDTLLKRVTNQTITGGVVLFCYRETPLAVGQLVAGELWNDLGGLYRIATQEV